VEQYRLPQPHRPQDVSQLALERRLPAAQESEVLLQPGHKWNNILFHNHTGLKMYPNYMMGGGYVLSGDVVTTLININRRMKLIFTPIEDATLGFWLMAMDLRHIDHAKCARGLLLQGLSVANRRGRCSVLVITEPEPAATCVFLGTGERGLAKAGRLQAAVRSCADSADEAVPVVRVRGIARPRRGRARGAAQVHDLCGALLLQGARAARGPAHRGALPAHGRDGGGPVLRGAYRVG